MHSLNSKDSELAVLGVAFLFPDTIPQILDNLHSHHFYTKEYKEVFNAIQKLYSHNKAVDFTTLSSELPDHKATLIGLVDFNGSSTALPDYITILRDNHAKQQVVRLLTAALDSFSNSSTERIVETLNKGLEIAIKETGAKETIKPPAVVGVEFMRDVEARHRGEITFSRLGISSLDDLIGPLEDGDLVAIGGRPGSGKSTFAENIAYNTASDKRPVLIWSCEMSENKLRRKLVSKYTGIDSMVLKKGNFADQDLETISKANDFISTLPIYIIYDTDFDYNSVSRHIDKIKPRIVIYDFLQQFDLKQTFVTQSEASAYAQIVKDIKKIGIKQGVVNALLSQVKREVDQRENDMMYMSDFHGSSGIEAKADVAIMLSNSLRSVIGLAEMVPATKFTIVKNRDGATSECYMMFDKRHSNFKEIEQ